MGYKLNLRKTARSEQADKLLLAIHLVEAVGQSLFRHGLRHAQIDSRKKAAIDRQEMWCKYEPRRLQFLPDLWRVAVFEDVVGLEALGDLGKMCTWRR